MHTRHAFDIKRLINHYHGGYNHKFGIVCFMYVSEITKITTTLVLDQRARINACFILHFSILTMLKRTYYFRKCEVAFFFDCYHYSCYHQ